MVSMIRRLARTFVAVVVMASIAPGCARVHIPAADLAQLDGYGTGQPPMEPHDDLVDDAGQCLWERWCHAVHADDGDRVFMRPATRLHLELDDGDSVGGRWRVLFVDGSQLRGVVQYANGTGDEILVDLASIESARLARYRLMDADWAPDSERSPAQAAIARSSRGDHPHRRRNRALGTGGVVVGIGLVGWGLFALMFAVTT